MAKAKPGADHLPSGHQAEDGVLDTALHPQYRAISELSRDSLGGLYRARNVADGRKVAVKVLPRYALSKGRALVAVDGGSTLEVLEVLEAPSGQLLVVLEQPRGTALDRLLSKHGSMPPPLAVSVGIGVLTALKSLHAAERVHGGVNPASVFVSRTISGQLDVKMAYFGLTEAGARLNDNAYLSPELATENGRPTPRSDLWAVGVLLFEALFNAHPFRGRSDNETLGRVLLEPLSLPIEFENDFPVLAAVLRRTLDKTERLRYPTAGAMVDALSEAVTGPDTDPPETPPPGDLLFARRDGRLSSVPTLPAPPHEALISESAHADPDITKPFSIATLVARERERAGFRPNRRLRLLAAAIAVIAVGLGLLGFWWVGGRSTSRRDGIPESEVKAPNTAAAPASVPSDKGSDANAERRAEEAAPPNPRDPAAAEAPHPSKRPTDDGKQASQSGRKPSHAEKEQPSSKGDETGPDDNLSSNPFQLKSNPFPLGE